MTVQIAHLFATGCLAICFFQIALIFGAPLGEYTQGGRVVGPLPVSGRCIAGLSIPILLFCAAAIVASAGFEGLDLPRRAGWAAVAVMALSTVLNWITPSRKERAIWGPITLVMTGLAARVMIATASLSAG